MAYDVEFVGLVRDYLAQVDGLTDDDRATIIDGIIDELSREAERFHALHPLAHESLCFRYDSRTRPPPCCTTSILSWTRAMRKWG